MKNIKFSLVCFYFKIKSGIRNSAGKDNYPVIIKKFKEQYYEIEARTPKEKGIMAFHRVFLIIGLALHKAMRDDFPNQEELIEEIHNILWKGRMITMIRFSAFFIRRSRDPFHRFLQLLGPKNEWFFLCPPWEKVEVELENGVGWHQKRCPYYEFFNKEGIVELTGAYCDMDKRIAALVSNHIELRRDNTLAKGNEWCDFLYFRKS